MKNIIKLSLLFFVLNINAQIVKPAEQYYTSNYINLDNVYFKDVNHIYDKFLGSWEYSSGPHYLKVVISKVVKKEFGVSSTGERLRTKKQFFDKIKIDYIYKYNGVTVYNVMPPYQVVNGNIVSSSISGHIITNYRSVNLGYNEPSTTTCMRGRTGRLQLTFIPNGGLPQLKWARTDQFSPKPDTYCPSGGQFDISEYKIPADIILNKI